MEPAEPDTASEQLGRPFEEGERLLLIDRKGRQKLLRLKAGRSYQSHSGVIEHDALIGLNEGAEVSARTNDEARRNPARYLALRPTLSDLVFHMPRGAQVIYPKDLGAILLAADIFPGARVLESGVGSGALSMALLRAGADVTGYELREDFALTAKNNVEAARGGSSRWGSYAVELRDLYEGIEGRYDRIVLDLPEPWRAVGHAAGALLPGGIFCSYLPSINQAAELRQALREGGFGLAETFEVLRRGWYIEGRAVRPELRMVGHTGFLTTARLLGPKAAEFELGEKDPGEES
jgi:tRNA (adenine57-N1/adenine58-N1)-methyltransferase